MEFFFVMVLVLVFFVSIGIQFLSRTKDSPTGHAPDRMFRIVELQNGMFRVQKWFNGRSCWDTPTVFGQYTFDTLDEAQMKKDRLIAEKQAEMAVRDGFSIKRVVR